MFLRTKNHLGQALPITEINKNDAAVVATGIDPARERDGLADVFLSETVAMGRAIHGNLGFKI